MQSVRSHEEASADLLRPPVACPDRRDDAVRFIAIGEHAVPELHRLRAQPLQHGTVQQHLQFAAVNRILRPAIAGEEPARLAVDILAVASDQGPFPRLDADPVECGGVEAQVEEFADRIGLQVDADAQGLQVPYRLEDDAGNADLVQRERQAHAADAAAGDENGGLRERRGGRVGHGRIVRHRSQASEERGWASVGSREAQSPLPGHHQTSAQDSCKAHKVPTPILASSAASRSVAVLAAGHRGGEHCGNTSPKDNTEAVRRWV
jgi:hypothetical protein